jgi:hypothetical protein
MLTTQEEYETSRQELGLSLVAMKMQTTIQNLQRYPKMQMTNLGYEQVRPEVTETEFVG